MGKPRALIVLCIVYILLRDEHWYAKEAASVSRVERNTSVLVEEEIALFASAFLRRALG